MNLGEIVQEAVSDLLAPVLGLLRHEAYHPCARSEVAVFSGKWGALIMGGWCKPHFVSWRPFRVETGFAYVRIGRHPWNR